VVERGNAQLTRCGRVVVAEFGELGFFRGDLDDVAVPSAGAGAVERLRGFRHGVYFLCVGGVRRVDAQGRCSPAGGSEWMGVRSSTSGRKCCVDRRRLGRVGRDWC